MCTTRPEYVFLCLYLYVLKSSGTIGPNAHTPNYFPHSISLNTNTSTRKTGKYKYKYEKIWLKLGLWFAIWERVTSQDESFGEGQIGMHIA